MSIDEVDFSVVPNPHFVLRQSAENEDITAKTQLLTAMHFSHLCQGAVIEVC
jgi:hypothetical protein